MNIYENLTDEEIKLKEIILSNKKRYKSDRDKILGNPISYRILEEEGQQIIHKYTIEKLSCREIGRQHSRCHSIISSFLKRKSIIVISSKELSRKYTLDEKYFEKINSHKKAY